MPKTYYLGRTKSGTPIARGSASRTDYTHAWAVADRMGGFSSSAIGAQRLIPPTYRARPDVEIIPVQKVTREEYAAATGKKG